MSKEEIEKKLQDLSQHYAKIASEIGDAEYKSKIWGERVTQKIQEAKVLDSQAAELQQQLKDLSEPKIQTS